MREPGPVVLRRLGFDAVRALRNSTGLGNYSRGVLRALHRHAAATELHLYSPEGPRPEFAGVPAALSAPLHLPQGLAASLLKGRPWRAFRLGRSARADGIDLYHGLTHEIPRDLPATGIPSVVTFHDLIFEQHPEYFPLVDRWSYRWRYRWSALHANAVVCVSARTRDELRRRYPVDPARLTVVPPPRDPAFARLVPDTERAHARIKYGLPGEFMLSVGTLEPRKNQGVLLAALAILNPRRALPLVLVGRDRGSAPALRRTIAELGLDDQVRLLEHVSTADLPAIVQSAVAFLYPSRSEGFGMPIVEALSCGVPVVAASGGHLHDAGGPGTQYADPDDPTAWAVAMAELIEDVTHAEAMSVVGQAYAERFDGGVVAARLMSIYEAVLGGRPLPDDTHASEVLVEGAR